MPISTKGKARSSPSPPTEGGEGWGEEGRFADDRQLTVTIRMPLSPALSPLVPRGEREKIRRRLLAQAIQKLRCSRAGSLVHLPPAARLVLR